MNGLMEYFCAVFIPKLKADDIADLSELIEIWSNASPICFKYNRDTFSRDLPPMILGNICANCQHERTFESHGLMALHSIVTQEPNKNSIARWCLTIHLSKLKDKSNHGVKLSYLLTKLSSMVVRTPDENHKLWIELAKRAIKHPEIEAIVDGSVRLFGVEPQTGTNMDISIVTNSIHTLRGFSGLDEIYINATYFEHRFQTSYTNAAESNLERVELAAQMSLLALVIHEFGNVKLRQAMGEFSVNTPTLAKEKSMSDDIQEIGQFCEVRTFGSRVGWCESQFAADMQYMKSFISALPTGNGNALPTGSPGRIINRNPSEAFECGLDMEEALDDIE